jgi:hypothetical protein
MKTTYTLALAVLAVFARVVPAQDELAQRTWSIPATADVKAKLDDYLSGKSLDEAAKLKIAALWPDEAQPLESGELLDRLTASLAVVEPKAAERRIAAAAGPRQPAAARRPLAGSARPGR